MPQDTRFSPEDPAEVRRREAAERRTQDAAIFDPDPPRRSCAKSCLVGCLWTGLALTIIGIIVGVWIAKNWRNWAADGGAEVIKQGFEQTELPEQEQDELGVQVDRLAEAFREGQISGREIGLIAQQVARSPLATSLIVSVVDARYLDRSGLPDDEREAGRQTLRRFARGVLDGSIPEQQRNAVLAHMADRQPDGSWQLRERVSDDELRAFLAAAKTEADAATIPDEPAVVDPSDELRKIIDAALNAAGAAQPADEDAAETPAAEATEEESIEEVP
jgi:hypothetical protein